MAESCPESAALKHQNDLLRMQLAHAQRLAAMGELLGTTAHEFNNVLMTVINYARLGMRNKDDASREKAFDKILSAGQRAAKITQTILGMARNRAKEYEPTDLRRLVEDTLLLLERELRKYRVKVETNFRDVPQFLGDGNQIQQVLLNLLTNARQAMPEGGRLAIEVRPNEAGSMVELYVRDWGCGMSADVARRIFEPFYTTKTGPDGSGKGGAGLGLSACRDIIEAHGGKIRVETAPGLGTAFTIRLPVAKTAAGAVGLPTVPPAGVAVQTG